MSLFTLGKLEIRNGVKTIVTSNEALAATNPVLQQFMHDCGNAVARQVDRDIMSSLCGLPVITSKYLPTNTVFFMEKPMATKTTKQLRVKLYDGPHHGRILLVPSNQRVFVLPNPMPAGEMWGAGRSNPSEFTAREYTYELRTPLRGGDPYLGYVETPRTTFVIPQPPRPQPVKISYEGASLITAAIDSGYNYARGDNGTRSERYSMLLRHRAALAEYISKLEQRVNDNAYGGRTIAQTTTINREF